MPERQPLLHKVLNPLQMCSKNEIPDFRGICEHSIKLADHEAIHFETVEIGTNFNHRAYTFHTKPY